jgi:hypothetical protein
VVDGRLVVAVGPIDVDIPANQLGLREWLLPGRIE